MRRRWIIFAGLSLVVSLVGRANELASPDLLINIKWQDLQLADCVTNSAMAKGWTKVEDVVELECHGKGIQSIDDLFVFSQLRSISLFNNDIESADFRGFEHLSYLNVANNRLKEINVTGLSQLKTLYLFKNNLTSLDFSGLTQISKIRITNNRLTNIDITPMRALTQGYFYDNRLKDLSVTGLDQLTFLDVRQNPMPDEVYDRYDAISGVTIVHDGNADDWK